MPWITIEAFEGTHSQIPDRLWRRRMGYRSLKIFHRSRKGVESRGGAVGQVTHICFRAH